MTHLPLITASCNSSVLVLVIDGGPAQSDSVYFTRAESLFTRAYALAGEVIASSFAHDEGKEGMAAFIEKRPPDWNK